ncbi:MAG: serine protease [Myxococcota bacterium]
MIGFWIGAQGEFVFAGPVPKGTPLVVRTQDGKEHPATSLGSDAATRLAVGRVDQSADAGEPLRPAPDPDLALDQWVLAVTLDAKGAPTPFAGVVEDTPRPGATRLARLGVPGQRGAPIVTLDGALIAVSVEDGSRHTRAVMLDSITAFLRASVLGG